MWKLFLCQLSTVTKMIRNVLLWLTGYWCILSDYPTEWHKTGAIFSVGINKKLSDSLFCIKFFLQAIFDKLTNSSCRCMTARKVCLNITGNSVPRTPKVWPSPHRRDTSTTTMSHLGTSSHTPPSKCTLEQVKNIDFQKVCLLKIGTLNVLNVWLSFAFSGGGLCSQLEQHFGHLLPPVRGPLPNSGQRQAHTHLALASGKLFF